MPAAADDGAPYDRAAGYGPADHCDTVDHDAGWWRWFVVDHDAGRWRWLVVDHDAGWWRWFAVDHDAGRSRDLEPVRPVEPG